MCSYLLNKEELDSLKSTLETLLLEENQASIDLKTALSKSTGKLAKANFDDIVQKVSDLQDIIKNSILIDTKTDKILEVSPQQQILFLIYIYLCRDPKEVKIISKMIQDIDPDSRYFNIKNVFYRKYSTINLTELSVSDWEEFVNNLNACYTILKKKRDLRNAKDMNEKLLSIYNASLIEQLPLIFESRGFKSCEDFLGSFLLLDFLNDSKIGSEELINLKSLVISNNSIYLIDKNSIVLKKLEDTDLSWCHLFYQ
jgi:hypothetical protein